MVKDNILKIKERVAQACSRVKRDPASVIIIGVSKGRQPEEIREAIGSGIADIGENKVQEAFVKRAQLSTTNYQPPTVHWHMIGHLQTNKAKEAVKLFNLIHSVDSLRLAQEIDKQAAKVDKVQDILLEVNISGETSKFGLKPEEVSGLFKEISGLKNIKINGLMTIAPLVNDPEQVRPYFKALKELQDKINLLALITYPLSILSMGMSDDFEFAIEEGATMVRIGRAIFDN
ncbi:MAG: YggS family pyridoxal phosphate-dependent enzyme [Candidatus Omnitrophota bacterium]|nr:YggS family pyridoxal phosphate-dependent enzyme [Candidatus Omnitrophota bacterium]MBU1928633.1 YggS family pyridoxal phosphate-dependent enzyme [Candidatus Omnitrophota bacterium]MBU2034749.1 YggS family pyridoxal phosphate-dependent enzyme [Candidatus Omnitrophota bacterium]MBU2221061.1 YggS family pyridoxal phosphate-dependent enzyme [Candidatus Omnitrophota bacterium]MBU2258580.1 YggS family pyridoxal phosphate-dependent enzyme [Candidatus Omnitrophota bacterium]